MESVSLAKSSSPADVDPLDVVVRLASPVKVGSGKDKRVGVLMAEGSRVRLVTDRGVEFDADRSELTAARADIVTFPKVSFGLRGVAYRMPLVAGARDDSGLVAGLRQAPHYRQHASAVAYWNRWFEPLTPQELAARQRERETAERSQRIRRERIIAANRLQTPVWHADSGRIAQLTLADRELLLLESDGTEVRLGDVRTLTCQWFESGSKAQLHIKSPAGVYTFQFRAPKQKGDAGSWFDGSDDGLAVLIALPVVGALAVAEKQLNAGRVRLWKRTIAKAAAQATA